MLADPSSEGVEHIRSCEEDLRMQVALAKARARERA